MALLTCPKCGMQYYGKGCPDCDYPPRETPPGEKKSNRRWGALFAAVGAGIALYASVHVEPAQPHWPGVVAGAEFFLAGLAMSTQPKGRISSLLGGLVAGGFASLGFYAAFSPVPIEGGIPFIPGAWNQAIGKTVFGFGAVICALFALWLFWRAIVPKPERQPLGSLRAKK